MDERQQREFEEYRPALEKQIAECSDEKLAGWINFHKGCDAGCIPAIRAMVFEEMALRCVKEYR